VRQALLRAHTRSSSFRARRPRTNARGRTEQGGAPLCARTRVHHPCPCTPPAHTRTRVRAIAQSWRVPALAVHAAGSCATRVRGAWPVCAHTHDHDPGPARHTRTRVCARALTRVYAQAVHAGPTGTPRTRVAQLPAAGPSRPAQPHRRCPRPAAPSAPRLQVLAHNGCNRVHEPTIVFPRQPGRPGVPSGLVDSEGPTWALRGCAVPDRPCGGQSGPRAAGRDAGCSHPCLRPPDEPWLRRAGLHNFSGWQWFGGTQPLMLHPRGFYTCCRRSPGHTESW